MKKTTKVTKTLKKVRRNGSANFEKKNWNQMGTVCVGKNAVQFRSRCGLTPVLRGVGCSGTSGGPYKSRWGGGYHR